VDSFGPGFKHMVGSFKVDGATIKAMEEKG
jgi:hypothetical protein